MSLDLRVEEECVLCSCLRETAGKEEREQGEDSCIAGCGNWIWRCAWLGYYSWGIEVEEQQLPCRVSKKDCQDHAPDQLKFATAKSVFTTL